MDKKKLIFVIIGTLLAMALVVAALLLWLLPADNGNKGEDGTQATNGAVIDDQNGEEGGETQSATQGNSQEPTVGVEVEVPGETTGNTGNQGGNSGNTGSQGGNSGNTGNQGGNNEIDFDDLLGNS